MGSLKNRPLRPDEERALAEAVLACEERARSALGELGGALSGRRKKGSEKTRAADVDALGLAVDDLWRLSKVRPELRDDARVARAAWAEAEALRWQLAMSGVRIAWGEARKLAGAFMDLEDLAQEGMIGLLRAAKRFDPGREIRFSTYARWWVRAQMTRAIDSSGRTIRLPGCAVEQTRNLRKAMMERDRAGVEWTTKELAAEVGVEPERAEFLLARGRALSLDDAAGEDGRPIGATLTDIDAIEADDGIAQTQEITRMLEATGRVLTDRHRHVIALRFGLRDGNEHSLSAIARGMDLSRERVRQLEREALDAMRNYGAIREAAA